MVDKSPVGVNVESEIEKSPAQSEEHVSNEAFTPSLSKSQKKKLRKKGVIRSEPGKD